jgi:hypothetical protein
MAFTRSTSRLSCAHAREGARSAAAQRAVLCTSVAPALLAGRTSAAAPRSAPHCPCTAGRTRRRGTTRPAAPPATQRAQAAPARCPRRTGGGSVSPARALCKRSREWPAHREQCGDVLERMVVALGLGVPLRELAPPQRAKPRVAHAQRLRSDPPVQSPRAAAGFPAPPRARTAQSACQFASSRSLRARSPCAASSRKAVEDSLVACSLGDCERHERFEPRPTWAGSHPRCTQPADRRLRGPVGTCCARAHSAPFSARLALTMAPPSFVSIDTMMACAAHTSTRWTPRSFARPCSLPRAPA